MVGHFIKFGRVILIKNKKAETNLSAFKQWLTSYLNPKNLHTDNGGEFKNKMMEFFLIIMITLPEVLIINNIKELLKY